MILTLLISVAIGKIALKILVGRPYNTPDKVEMSTILKNITNLTQFNIWNEPVNFIISHKHKTPSTGV